MFERLSIDDSDFGIKFSYKIQTIQNGLDQAVHTLNSRMSYLKLKQGFKDYLVAR